MRKITSTYFATVHGPRIARKLGQASHISQVRLVGSYPSKTAFIRAASAARDAANTPQVDKTMLGDGSLVKDLEPETLYVCPLDAYGDRHYVRLDEYHPELRPATEATEPSADEAVDALLAQLRDFPAPNHITAEQRTQMYATRDAATALLAPTYEQLTCSELLDIAVAAHPDGIHVRDAAAETQSNAALTVVDRRHPGIDVVAQWEATAAPTFIEAVRALYDAHDPDCQVHRRFE